MRKLPFLACLLYVLLLGACTSEDVIIPPQADENSSGPVARISMRTASERLARLLPAFTTVTRSGSTGDIGPGVALDKDQKPLTRSDESEAWFYYFPIDGGKRFAIMSARTDLPEILALGNDRPNWEVPSASVPNPMRWNISATVRAAEERNRAIADSLKAGGSSGDIGIGKEDTVVIVRGTPYVVYAAGVEPTDLCPVKWGQDPPYNSLCPPNRFHPVHLSKTCCVATAVAQLFACEKMRPASYRNYTFDWDLLVSCPDSSYMWRNPEALSQVSRLMFELGSKENLNVKYSEFEWVSTAYPQNITRTLRNFGVHEPGSLRNYSTSLVIEDLKRGYPVIMNGYNPVDLSGHTWVVHGMLTMATPVYVYVGKELSEVLYEYEYYFDVNWGFDSVGDGYYIETGFNPSRPADFNPHNYPFNEKGWGGDDLNSYKSIQYGVKMTPNE